MASENTRFRFSRLEILLMVLILSVIGASVFLLSQSHRQLSVSKPVVSDSGDLLTDPDSQSVNGGDDRGAGGTNAGFVSSEFSEKSLAIVLPAPGNATNKEVLPDGASLDLAGDKKSVNTLPASLGDIEAELRRIAELPWGPETEKQLQNVLAQWGGSDPASALAYALKLEGLRAGTTAVGNILAQWAKSDPAAAFNWFNNNLANNPQLLKGTASSLFAKMAEANPILALNNAWQLEQKDIRDTALHAIVNQMMAAGQKDQLLQYFNAMNDTTSQSMLVRAMVDQWATYYPEMTAEWIAGLNDPTVRNTAAMALIATWGYDNPAKTAQWVASLTKDENWSAEVSRMVRVWARESPDQAATWLLALSPPAAQLDPAVRQLVHTVMHANPEGAMAWANAISATDQRHRLMQRVGAIWMHKDPAQASAYIMSSDLPDWVKKRLLRTH
ncbi:MAG: hypothetical protein Q7J98_11900 [Kiritimatiellia bacterium]|nr:hypothetical protein [Kiritimatiellia bacterium]